MDEIRGGLIGGLGNRMQDRRRRKSLYGVGICGWMISDRSDRQRIGGDYIARSDDEWKRPSTERCLVRPGDAHPRVSMKLAIRGSGGRATGREGLATRRAEMKRPGLVFRSTGLSLPQTERTTIGGGASHSFRRCSQLFWEMRSIGSRLDRSCSCVNRAVRWG